MPRHKELQTNFSAGELAPDLAARQDTEQYQNGAKSLRNRRCLIGGGTKRRPGTLYQADLPARPQLAEWIVNQSTQYAISFTAERMDAYLKNNSTGVLTASGSLSGTPWTGDMVPDLHWWQSGNTMFATHETMWPQILMRTGAATWSRTQLVFKTGAAGRPEQPYLKFAPADMTLTCSDVTGSITLTVSGSTAYFVAAHVGTYIRYRKKACLITAVAANGLSCTATVIEKLPETYDLTVNSSANFAVGEALEGSSTGAKATITDIPSSTHITCILSEKLIAFTTSDTLVGPQASTTISNVSTTTNGPVLDWDEQMFSPVYGYPSCGTLHRNRLLFAGHPAAPDYLIASALGDLYNFNVGTGADGDAILETVGDAGASRIVQLHSSEQLLVLTDKGPYYVPESASAPFRPSSIAFFPFGSPWPITASARARAFDNGVLFCSRSLVIKATPTGNTQQQWQASETSFVAHHLISNPTGLSVTSNFAGGPERYAVIQNDDGTMALMQLVEDQKIRNFTPWDTGGEIVSTCALDEHLYQAVIRSVAGNTRYILELYDQDVTLDAATEYTSLSDTALVTRYGATTVNVVAGDYHLGTLPLSITRPPAGPYMVGLFYESVLETLPPVIEDQEGSKAGDLMRILRADVKVMQSARFAANGRSLQAYSVTDQVDAAPPRKDGWQRLNFLGWSKEPTISITQTDPLPLDLLGIRSVVAY